MKTLRFLLALILAAPALAPAAVTAWHDSNGVFAVQTTMKAGDEFLYNITNSGAGTFATKRLPAQYLFSSGLAWAPILEASNNLALLSIAATQDLAAVVQPTNENLTKWGDLTTNLFYLRLLGGNAENGQQIQAPDFTGQLGVSGPVPNVGRNYLWIGTGTSTNAWGSGIGMMQPAWFGADDYQETNFMDAWQFVVNGHTNYQAKEDYTDVEGADAVIRIRNMRISKPSMLAADSVKWKNDLDHTLGTELDEYGAHYFGVGNPLHEEALAGVAFIGVNGNRPWTIQTTYGATPGNQKQLYVLDPGSGFDSSSGAVSYWLYPPDTSNTGSYTNPAVTPMMRFFHKQASLSLRSNIWTWRMIVTNGFLVGTDGELLNQFGGGFIINTNGGFIGENSAWTFDSPYTATRFGVIKKSGQAPAMVHGSGIGFRVARSSVANLLGTAVTGQTLTDDFGSDASGNFFVYASAGAPTVTGTQNAIRNDAGTAYLVTATRTNSLAPLVSGKATLAAGAVVVSTTAAETTNLISLAYYSLDGTLSTVAYKDVTNGASFTIISGSATDTNQVDWFIWKP